MIAIYARQSIDKKDSLSMSVQIDTCKALCNLEPFVTYEDKGFSGKTINRPAFNNLLDDIKNGKINKIIVYRLDRLSRSVLDFATLWKIFKENNVDFISVNENFDTSTPMGVAMINIAMVFAELERQTIAERVKDNYYVRVKKGAWAGGPAPFGFEIVKENKMSCLKQTKEIEIVKLIFDEYAKENASLRKVALMLNKQNIPCAKRKFWDNVSVGRIIKNPIYVKADAFVYRYYKNKDIIIHNEIEEFNGKYGCLIVGKREANERKYTSFSNHLLAISNCEGIIDSKTFLTCQYHMEENIQIKNTGTSNYTWLSGLLKCASCGYTLGVQKNKEYFYLVCSGRKNMQICSVTHSEKIGYIEKYVSEKLMEYITSQPYKKINKEQDIKSGDILNEIAICEEKIKHLIEKLMQASEVTAKYINIEVENLDKKIKELNEKLPKVKTNILDLGQNFSSINFNDIPFRLKQRLAKAYIKQIECLNDDIKITYN